MSFGFYPQINRKRNKQQIISDRLTMDYTISTIRQNSNHFWRHAVTGGPLEHTEREKNEISVGIVKFYLQDFQFLVQMAALHTEQFGCL